jgi:hypothetical protein
MDELGNTLDLDLWSDTDLIRRQSLLKRQFLAMMEDVANEIPLYELNKISSRTRGSKISRGNDLLGFPYQVLDVIRDFDTSTGINIRLLNWYGNGFFLTVLLGKERENPVFKFLQEGYSYGLSENKWDYPDLLLNGNQSSDPETIVQTVSDFHLWVKPITLSTLPVTNVQFLVREIKKILAIVEVPSEQSRI